jgi:AraC-like DNA-binding protein
VRLRTDNEPISAIAFDAGFGDLSTFNRRFRRVMGCSPRAYARAAPGAGGAARILARGQTPGPNVGAKAESVRGG